MKPHSQRDDGQEWRVNTERSLANHFSRLLINEARSSVASETLVHLALVPFKPGGTHTLHVAAAG